MKYRSGLTVFAASLALLAGLGSASAPDVVPGHGHQATWTRSCSTPILVAAASEDGKIFVKKYVSKEAEHQILTGDPGMKAKAIGSGASVGHGKPRALNRCVLLAPGKSVTFAISTGAKKVYVSSRWSQPTMYKDHYVTAVVDLGGKAMSVALDRFDIGHDEKRMTITPVSKAAVDGEASPPSNLSRPTGRRPRTPPPALPFPR